MHDRATSNLQAMLQRNLTRRTFVRGLAITASLPMAGLLGACGGEDEDEPSAPATTGAADAPTEPVAASTTAAEGEWSFTDDRGVTITLPQRPERIVAYVATGAALWDFGVRSVGVYGTTLRPDGTPEITTGSLDLDAVESLGEIYGEMDLERLAALQPDLIVADLWTETLDLWGLDEGASGHVESIAPVVGIRYIDRSVSELIGGIGELANALGADLDAPDVLEAREGFDRASGDLEAAIAETPGLMAMFIAGWPDALYIANPEAWADLIYFHDLGLDIVMPDALDEGYPIWQTLSWEQASKYSADVVFQDGRAGSPTPGELTEIATWAAHPAAQADQVVLWRTEFVASYQGFTVVLEDLTESITAAEDIVDV